MDFVAEDATDMVKDYRGVRGACTVLRVMGCALQGLDGAGFCLWGWPGWMREARRIVQAIIERKEREFRRDERYLMSWV